MKTFKSIEDQLTILKSRGLKFKDTEKAKRYLLTNNYYNIINGYSKYFFNKGTRCYLENSTFDEITHLYFFAKEVKHALFKYITEAENHIKSVLAHRFAESYPAKKYPYLDINCYDGTQVLALGKVVSSFSSIINRHKSMNNRNSIKHYVDKHEDVPIWVLIDYMTFGNISILFSKLSNNIKNKVAKDMCSFSVSD